ncbi:MAG: lysozyme inhibitor LprI family protein [Erythrobacter sp.]
MIAAMLLALAAPANDLPQCDQEAAERGVQQEMNICAHREYLIADAALNEQWRITRDHMKARDANPDRAPDDRPGNFETLLEAQRAWIEYRDAHCRSEGYAARGGSLEPLLVSTCMQHLTQQRIDQLEELSDTF